MREVGFCFIVAMMVCMPAIVTGCITQEKQDVILDSYSKVLQEYDVVYQEYVKLLDWVIGKNIDNPVVVEELKKAIKEAENARILVGNLSEDIYTAVQNSTLTENDKLLILEILDKVIPEDK